MEPAIAITVALISAISGLISGLVVAYAKPLAEEQATARREGREARRRHLQLMWDALLDPRNSYRTLPVLASALDDPELSEAVERVLAADTTEEREVALTDARRRLGVLLRG